MKTLRTICIILVAAGIILKLYPCSAEKQQASQTVRIIENNVNNKGIKVMCLKDTEKLLSGDICVLYPGEDTTIRKMDGTVIDREDLQIGETVQLQYESGGLGYNSKEQVYKISRIAFIVKPGNDELG